MSSQILEDIKNVANKNNVSLTTIATIIRNEQSREQFENSKKQYEINESKWVGRYFVKKCRPHSGMFPIMSRFYKVVSARVSGLQEVACVTFDEHPYYWFDYQHHALYHPLDYYVGEFDFEPIKIANVNISDFSEMKEIDEGEWKYYLMNLVTELCEMKWTEDHYRFGGKLPSDPEWVTKEEPINNFSL